MGQSLPVQPLRPTQDA